MEYKLIKSSCKDIERLIEYKKKTIFEYSKDLSEEEINKQIENTVAKHKEKWIK